MAKEEGMMLDEQMIVVGIPTEAVKVELTAWVVNDVEEPPKKVSKTLSLPEIGNCRKEYLSLDPDDGATYIISELYKEFLKDDSGLTWEEYWDANSAERD